YRILTPSSPNPRLRPEIRASVPKPAPLGRLRPETHASSTIPAAPAADGRPQPAKGRPSAARRQLPPYPGPGRQPASPGRQPVAGDAKARNSYLARDPGPCVALLASPEELHVDRHQSGPDWERTAHEPTGVGDDRDPAPVAAVADVEVGV